jgi:glycosyltransferase involved in cell wall biosynthesis
VTTCSEINPLIVAQSGKKDFLVRSVPTGIDPLKMGFLQEECDRFRNSLQLTSSVFLVGTACFMRSWKGIFDLLQAADLMREEKNVKWVIIGGGHEEIYRERAKKLALEGIVHFTGHLADPIPALNALNAFVLLSTAHEGVSQALLQAAYLKKPLIATPTGGLKEVCIDGQTGISVAPFSPQEVVKAVTQLIGQRELCDQLGAEAQKLVLRQFTLTQMLDQMEEIYYSV